MTTLMLVPIADGTDVAFIFGSWGSPEFQNIDEGLVPNDGDVAAGPCLDGSAGPFGHFARAAKYWKLSNPGAVGSIASARVVVRARYTGVDLPDSFVYSLYQNEPTGGGVVFNSTPIVLTTSFVDYQHALTGPELALISNWANLFVDADSLINLNPGSPHGPLSYTLQISDIFLEITLSGGITDVADPATVTLDCAAGDPASPTFTDLSDPAQPTFTDLTDPT